MTPDDTPADDTPADDGDSSADDDIDLADRAREDLLQIVTSLASGSAEDALAALDDLEAVATEADELASTVDGDDLPDAVDLRELPDAIDVESIARAIVSGDAGDAVDKSELLDVLELGDLWDAVDVREFWRNAEELEAAIEDALGEEALAEWKGYVGEQMDDADDGDDDLEVEWDDFADAAESDSMQTVIQMQMRDAVDEFREGVLDARKQLVKRREELGQKTSSVGQPDSRNPTAFSTMAASRSDIGEAAKHSTVPMETRYSSAPNRKRIYGSRFEDPAEDTEGDDA
ncbi:hypothetical protein ACFPYI_15860 [Halomarina salina]|uniref:Uncharacterized protein n=1 Tax=Halomarina salina TaxID=1872699 RepID=A0ABD5RQP0_9EURY|nr:hypothetical protein [Halomarina salina]